MCTSVRMELESIGFLTSGKVLNVVNKIGTLNLVDKGGELEEEEDIIT